MAFILTLDDCCARIVLKLTQISLHETCLLSSSEKRNLQTLMLGWLGKLFDSFSRLYWTPKNHDYVSKLFMLIFTHIRFIKRKHSNLCFLLFLSASAWKTAAGSNNPFPAFYSTPILAVVGASVWVKRTTKRKTHRHSFTLFRNMLFGDVSVQCLRYYEKYVREESKLVHKESWGKEGKSTLEMVNRIIMIKKISWNHMCRCLPENFRYQNNLSALYRCVSGPSFAYLLVLVPIMTRMGLWKCMERNRLRLLRLRLRRLANVHCMVESNEANGKLTLSLDAFIELDNANTTRTRACKARILMCNCILL